MLWFFEAIHFYISLAILAIALTILWIQGRNLSYLFFCAVFGIYLIGVVSVVVFPIYIPETNIEFSKLQLNLVPFNFGGCDFLFLCIRNIYENILLTIPFGFGISFITRIRPKNIFGLAITVGFILEFVQITISLIVRSSFRAADINDVILNATGVLLGCSIFKIFGWVYLFLIQKLNLRPKYIFAYIYDIAWNHHPHPRLD